MKVDELKDEIAKMNFNKLNEKDISIIIDKIKLCGIKEDKIVGKL